MNAADGRGPVDRDVGRLPRYCLKPRIVGNDTLCFRDDYDQHGDWTPWAQAQAELDLMRADRDTLARALQAIADCDPSLAADGVRLIARNALTPNAEVSGGGTPSA